MAPPESRMSAVQRDYIERIIEECAQALAQIVQLIRAGEFDPALIMVHKTCDVLLGPIRPVLERLDAASAVDLLGPYELDRIRMYAALLGEEGAIREYRGQTARATQCYSRALELYVAISMSGARLKTADLERIALLQSQVDVDAIDPRYRDELLRLACQTLPPA
jgi:hypothetical protein